MPKGKPKAGFRRTQRYKNKSIQELERDLANKVPDIIAELEKLTKPFSCPHCGNEVKVIDKDVGMYLVDRVMGKPKQKHEVDITENIQLTADQVDILIEKHIEAFIALIAERHLGLLVDKYREPVRALLTEAPPGNTETNEN